MLAGACNRLDPTGKRASFEVRGPRRYNSFSGSLSSSRIVGDTPFKKRCAIWCSSGRLKHKPWRTRGKGFFYFWIGVIRGSNRAFCFVFSVIFLAEKALFLFEGSIRLYCLLCFLSCCLWMRREMVSCTCTFAWPPYKSA